MSLICRSGDHVSGRANACNGRPHTTRHLTVLIATTEEGLDIPYAFVAHARHAPCPRMRRRFFFPGTDVVSSTAADAGTDTDTDAGTDTGTDTNTNTNTNIASESRRSTSPLGDTIRRS